MQTYLSQSIALACLCIEMAIYLIKKPNWLATTNADNNIGVTKHLHVFLAREWTAFVFTQQNQYFRL